jgi:poly(ADP-ribose) glycohydrolase
VTGKWGCGAFRGDCELKFVIQWLACSWVDRKYVFVNWGEDHKNEHYEEVVKRLAKRKTTDVLQVLVDYGQARKK